MKRAVVVLSVLLVASAAIAKKPLQQAKSSSTTLHVTTHLVQVNVIALDLHGHPITGLTRKDFKVFDNGKEQTISVFRVVSNRPAPGPPVRLPPDTFSNQIERAENVVPTVTVILLDALNTPFADQEYARKQVVKFLQQLHPSDHVALYALGRKLEVLHDFTSDAAPLLEALRRYQTGDVSEMHAAKRDLPSGLPGQAELAAVSEGALSGAGARGPLAEQARIGQYFKESQNLQKDYLARQRVRITTGALISIADHLAGLPGQKNLIWISGGFPMWRNLDKMFRPDSPSWVENFSSPITRAAQALNHVNLAIYPVDARGLMVAPGISAMRQRAPRRVNLRFADNFATMDDLALRTGGKAYYNTNNIFGSIRRVVDHSSMTYVLGYYPKDVKWDGAYREIKVRVDHRWARLQYRHGYVALAGEKPLASTNKAALDAALASPLNATRIGVTVRMVPARNPKHPKQTSYLMHFVLDSWDVTFVKRGDRWNANLTLLTGELSPEGETLDGVAQKLRLHLDLPTYRSVLSNGLRFSEWLPLRLQSGAERLRIVVQDDAKGAMGSVSIPLDRIQQLAKPSSAKAISGR